MAHKNRFWALVPAAGVGSRMGADIPKQYLSIANKTIIEHTLGRLLSVSALQKIVVAIAPEDPYWPKLSLNSHSRLIVADGGAERCHSVLNGLRVLADTVDENDWVLVHDVARPCVRISDIYKMMDALADHPVGGILAMPVRDTMKRGDNEGNIIETVDRNHLWHALTPQMFRLGVLKRSLESALEKGALVTDEASAMELAGHIPKLVEGARDNIKVTFKSDLALARFYLQEQGF